MRLATLKGDTPDGELIVVSRDGSRALPAHGVAPSLLDAIERWILVEPLLRDLAARLDDGEGMALEHARLRAPLPRTWQWLDGSAFSTHGKLMQIAFAHDPIDGDRPLMYQGLSDRFYGPSDEIPFVSEEHGIDFEGEFGVVIDHVPMGTSAADAAGHIKLVVQINDWSLRALAPVEMKTGFGWVQAKPACSVAPFAVTLDELGDLWQDGRVCLDLEIEWNGKPFGHANGRAMDFGFHELVAHAAATRDLAAGTIIGSGTVSNENYAEVGSSCISEVRAIEMIASGGAPTTSFMRFGDQVRMEAKGADGGSPFGVIEQVVRSA